MRISARNTLRGKIVDIKKGAVMALVVLELGTGERVSSAITVDAAEELALKLGDEVHAIVKATEVMIARQ